jgi:hypothetical protein
MSEKISRQASVSTPESPQNALLREAFPEYWAAVSALHLVQSTAARKLKGVLDSRISRITTSCRLEKEPAEASRSITPDFPADDYEYEAAEICALMWLGTPQNATLWLYLWFSRSDDNQGNRDIRLAAAFEVQQQYRRGELEMKLGGNKDYFTEEWEGYGVGLRRPLRSVDSLEDEATAILDELLSCIEA